jgi:hypothetical protein
MKKRENFGIFILGCFGTMGAVVGFSHYANASIPDNEVRGPKNPSEKSDESAEGDRKPLEVNGQSRNLNMALVLRDEKDKIKFVKLRENYREEIVGQTKKEQE